MTIVHGGLRYNFLVAQILFVMQNVALFIDCESD